MDKGGRELLVAVGFGLAASEAVADRRYSFQMRRWEAYATLYKKVGFVIVLAFLLHNLATKDFLRVKSPDISL